MDWFNYYGLIIVIAILLPNVIAAVISKRRGCAFFDNVKVKKIFVCLEQIGRYGCMAFMIFNIPYTWIGFYITYGLIIYLVVNCVLAAIYWLLWAILCNKGGIVRSLLLSLVPSVIFIFSAVMIASIPLFLCAIIFALSHIYISVKSARINFPDESKIAKKSVLSVTAVVLAVIILFVSTFGCATWYNVNAMSGVKNMTSTQMIEYDCAKSGTKISVAIIENGVVTRHIYGNETSDDDIYEYEIGSISKTFVGLLCAKAVNEGKLNLSDGIDKYLGFDGTRYYPTIERLLTHTSGYQGYYFEGGMIANEFAHIYNDFYGISKEQIVNKAKSIVLEDKDYPFNYSNFGISVVGLVLEKIYSKDFTQLMNEYIEGELGLKNTAVAAQSGNLSGYWKWKQGDGYIPAGAIISNINDMADYLNLYLSGGLPYVADSYRQIKEVNVSAGMNEQFNIRIDGVGMTWIEDNKNDIVWHNGSTTNFNSYIGFTKDKSKGVVVLGNLGSSEGVSLTVIGTKLLLDN
jgi:CubicO group peptidase (beta-lactamase class C family)